MKRKSLKVRNPGFFFSPKVDTFTPHQPRDDVGGGSQSETLEITDEKAAHEHAVVKQRNAFEQGITTVVNVTSSMPQVP